MSANPLAGLRLEFFTDPAEFLAAAGDYLAADPVVGTTDANEDAPTRVNGFDAHL